MLTSFHPRHHQENSPTVVVFNSHASLNRYASLLGTVRSAGGQVFFIHPPGAQPPKEGEALTFLSIESYTPQSVRRIFTRAGKGGRAPDLVIFDAGQTVVRPLLEWSAADAMDAWQRECLAAFLVGKEAITRMQVAGQGTLVFVGQSERENLQAPFTMGKACKAGTRAIAQSMARTFGPKNIHVAQISVDREPSHETQTIVGDTCWYLHNQRRTAWTQELDLR